ncbi:MAG: tail fiber domain-containing protein [Pseudobdellovibrio sp.]
MISFSLGSGVKQYPVSATTFAEIFDNSKPSLSCDDGDPGSPDPLYVPQVNHTRKIVMQFQDAHGWQTLPAMSVNAVPYAMYATEAQKLGGVSAGAYVKYSTLPTCGVSEALRYNGVSFSCISGGSLSSVSSGDITTALGYTPANQASVGASFTLATSYYNNLEASHTSLSNSVGVSFALATGYYNALAASHTLLSGDVSVLRLSVSGTQSDITSLQSSVGSLTASMSAMTGSQWSTSGTTINYMNGNVGIGISNPSVKLEVSGAIKIADGTQGIGRVLTSDANGLASWQVLPTGASGTVTNVSSTNSYISIINPTTAPSLTLNVGTASNTVAAGNDSRLVGALQASNNLSDVVSAAQVRSNLGLGSAAVYNVGIGADNIVQLNGSSQLPALNAALLTNINADNISSGSLSPLRLPAFTGDVTSASGTNTLTLVNSGVVTSTYSKVTVDAKGRVTSGSQLTLGDVTDALGYTPAASGSVSSQWSTSGTTISYSSGNVGIGTTTPGASLEVSGTVKITGGAPGAGKVLTSDASGLASWVTLSASQWNTSGTTINYMAGKVGIGDTNPSFKLSLSGTATTADRKIGINGTQVVYLPDQTNFTGSLFIGDGGGLLSHSSGIQGFYNTSVGIGALVSNTTGARNVANGYQALAANTTGSGNVANGTFALSYNTTGNYNVANGQFALSSNTTGIDNVANGHYALDSNTTGSNNTATGANSLNLNTSGTANVANGDHALYYNRARSQSTAIGYNSMYYAHDSSLPGITYNTAIGAYSLYGSTTAGNNWGTQNTALGHSALRNLQSGSGNVGVGYNAGSAITTGSNNVVIGSNTGSSIATSSNNILISDGAGNERMRITSAGAVGIGTTTPGYKLDVSGTLRVTGQAYTNTGNGSFSILSDIRYKDFHGNFDRGLAEILNIDIIKFNYKKDNPLGSDSSREYVGVSAQNLQQAIPEAVEPRKVGKEEYLTINTSPVLWTLINAVKQLYKHVMERFEGLDRQIASIVESKADKAEIEVLKRKASEMDSLKAKSDKLEAENAAKAKEIDALKSYLCSKDPAAPICK